MDTSKTVVFMVFHSNAQANIIKGLLEANEVPCFLSNENGPYGVPFFSTELGLIRLNILEKDIALAKSILTGNHIENSADTEQ